MILENHPTADRHGTEALAAFRAWTSKSVSWMQLRLGQLVIVWRHMKGETPSAALLTQPAGIETGPLPARQEHVIAQPCSGVQPRTLKPHGIATSCCLHETATGSKCWDKQIEEKIACHPQLWLHKKSHLRFH